MIRILTPHYRILITKAVLYKNIQNIINHVFSKQWISNISSKDHFAYNKASNFPTLNILFNSTNQRIVKKGKIVKLRVINGLYEVIKSGLC